MRMLVSDMAGRASIELKGRELGFDLAGDRELARPGDRPGQGPGGRGYTFEAADASFELLLREEVDGHRPDLFEVESWRVIVDAHGDGTVGDAEATVKVRAGGERVVAVGEGNGPVNALDHALRNALVPDVPGARRSSSSSTTRCASSTRRTAPTRSPACSSRPPTARRPWETVGVHANIIEASWEALVDAVTYGLLRHGRT